ncbi:MAG TPA: hypothetical protein PKD26_14270 [Pyrinomonadaceae bacterium]|nr:hypothetical protein [Pyrinomonadaceae bacterium]
MKEIKHRAECPKCGGSRIREWNDLTDDQRMLAERLPASAEFTPAERKKHRFCTRCWFEFTEREGASA